MKHDDKSDEKMEQSKMHRIHVSKAMKKHDRKMKGPKKHSS